MRDMRSQPDPSCDSCSWLGKGFTIFLCSGSPAWAQFSIALLDGSSDILRSQGETAEPLCKQSYSRCMRRVIYYGHI